MMALAQQKMTLSEFLAWEDQQPERHEFHNGEVFAMVGGRRIHERVIANLSRRLGNQLEGSACQVFAAGMKLQLADDTVLYPDVMVTCDRADLRADLAMRAPTLVVEVLSPSTRRIDLYEKLLAYQSIAALHTYVIVVQDRREVSVFRRSFGWVKETLSAEGTLGIPELDFSLPLDAIYARVSF